MKDVAARAGVSIFTVSQVINQAQTVRSETAAKVRVAIEELSYVPNHTARSLRTNRTKTVGVHMPIFGSSPTGRAFFSAVGQGIYDALVAEGYRMLLSSPNLSGDDEAAQIIQLTFRGVEGLIVGPGRGSELTEFTSHVPIVIVDRDIPGLHADRVFNDNFESTKTAVDYLVNRGHRRIAYLGSTIESNHNERYRGYLAALRRGGLGVEKSLVWDESTIDLSEADPSQVSVKAYELLKRSATAVFCNDALATISLMEAIKEAGMRIPEDLALVVYDDYDWFGLVSPPLTAVAQPSYELGHSAARLLLARINNPQKPFEEVRLPSTLIIRESA